METMTSVRTVDMDTVRRAHRGHWFDPGTLRFFGSRVGSVAYESTDGRFRFFVSSERYRSMMPAWDGRRFYSVRVQRVESGDIDTVGEFGAYASRREANADAQAYAADPASACSLTVGDGGSCPIHDEWHQVANPQYDINA